MDIKQMHATFRTLAQQMGMQLNRGILPESIDIFLNDAIIELVRTEIAKGVRTAIQDNVDTQSMTMPTINLFRNMYRTDTTKNFEIVEQNENGYYTVNLDSYEGDTMMYLGFSLKYKDSIPGRLTAARLIGADVLETTLRDYCNGASKDSPIVCLCGFGSIPTGLEIYTNDPNNSLEAVVTKRIMMPDTVKYSVKDGEESINCNLPDYVHYEIVERAVMKFYQSIGATTPQQQRQNINR